MFESRVPISQSVVPVPKKLNWTDLKTHMIINNNFCILTGLQTDVDAARKLVMQVV